MKFDRNDENYVYDFVGKNIRHYRKQRGWTQKQLAANIFIRYSLENITSIRSRNVWIMQRTQNRNRRNILLLKVYKSYTFFRGKKLESH